MPDLDLEELKRLVAEEGPRLKVDLAQMRHSGLTLVNALPELIARVERAEKALAFIRDENWAWATRETPSEAPRRVYGRWSEVARTVVPEPAIMTPSLTGDPDLDARLKKSIRWFNSLSAKQQEEHLRKQRESWVRGEMGLGPDNKRATINQEGGDRNQLDRRQDREDKSPPAVEAPAAGEPSLHEDVCSHARKLAREIHEDVMAGEDEIADAIEAGFRYREQRLTALARRLAESLAEARDRLLVASKDAAGSAYAYQMAGKAAQAHYLDQHRAALDILLDRLNPALTEARKVGLIE